MSKLRLMVCLSILVILLCAIDENNFEATFAQEVWPYYQAGQSGFFTGTDGFKIAYYTHLVPNEKGAVILLSGQSETYQKYAELIYDLRELEYSFYIMDHRGMGESERLLADPQKKYVADFEDYVSDVKIFYNSIYNSIPHAKKVLMAHSMGGAVATRYLETYPEDFDAAVLSAPMLQINTAPFPEAFAYRIVSAATKLGRGENYAIGEGPQDFVSCVESELSNSIPRCQVWDDIIQERNYPTSLWGSTNNWVKTSIEATWKLQAEASRIKTPVLLFQAGEDVYVMPEGQDRVCQAALECTKVFFAESRHEILMEVDAVRDRALGEIIAFLGN